jgi:uncharacterized protein (DUF1499 family)
MDRIILIGFILAVVSGLAALLAGFGTNWGWWNFPIGFKVLTGGAFGGLLAAVLCFIGALSAFRHGARNGVLLGALGFVLGLVVVGIPASWMQAARRLPMIHDITTDTQNPPKFVAVLPLRRNAPNTSEYGGPKVAAEQIKAYPDIRPLELHLSPDRAFEKALSAARGMGWQIIDSDRGQGRIEASATTFWFGFVDDVVIRITPVGPGSRVDARSESRVGKSDIGANAKRIRIFLKEMRTGG